MRRIKTGSGLWRQLTKRAGLNVRTYDAGVEVSFRNRLDLPDTGSVTTHLTQRKIRPEPVMGGFLNSIQPFSFIFKDILALVEDVGRKAGEDNLLIEFDFEEGKKFNVDLDNFREQVEHVNRAIRPITIDRWTYERFWDLWRAFGEPAPQDANDNVNRWAQEYLAGRWPTYDLDPPQFEDAVLNEYVARAWRVRRAMIDAARQVGPRLSDLRNRADSLREPLPNEIELLDEQVGMDHGVIGFLAQVHSDRWTVLVAAKAYQRAIDVRANPTFAAHLTTELGKVLNNPPAQQRDLETAISEFEDLLSLPVWKLRHELYSIWILTQMIEALGGIENFDFMLEGEIFHIPFSAKLLAILKDVTPPVRIWSEVRFPLAKPRGKSRKEGMQPDYTLTVDTEDPPSGSFALVECKQYLRASVKNFSDAVIDYATGQPQAQVALVDYGPAGPSIMRAVPVKLAPRVRIIGDLHPLNPASEIEFHDWIRNEIDKISKRVAPVAVASEGASKDKPLSPNEVAQIELRWNALPRDLDLHVFVVGNEAVVNYQSLGAMDSWPWMKLADDVKDGFGPEIVSIGNNATQTYRIEVHAYSYDGFLSQSGAVVTIIIKDQESRVFNCPVNGEGRWWYVCDINFSTGIITDVNSIHD